MSPKIRQPWLQDERERWNEKHVQSMTEDHGVLLHQYLQAYIKSQACQEQSTNTESHKNIQPKKISNLHPSTLFTSTPRCRNTEYSVDKSTHTGTYGAKKSDKPQHRRSLPTPHPPTPSLVQLKWLNHNVNYQQRCEGRHQRSSVCSQNLFTSKAMTSQVRAATRRIWYDEVVRMFRNCLFHQTRRCKVESVEIKRFIYLFTEAWKTLDDG